MFFKAGTVVVDLIKYGENYLEFNKSIIPGVEIKRCKNTSYETKSHVHHELSLGLILEGATDLTLNDQVLHYQTGDGVIIPPLTTHRCAPLDINRWTYTMLFINPNYYKGALRFERARKLDGQDVLKLTDFLEQLFMEENPDILEMILVELLVEFADPSPINPLGKPANSTKTIHDYILSHVDEVISLSHLEHLSGLNKFTLIRNFKKEYVSTPAAFHLQCRVAEAKTLLSGGMNVFDICARLNFCDQAHLIREFKKMYGITPNVYREQIK